MSPKLPPPRSTVAVALTLWPAATVTPLSMALKLALPLASVLFFRWLVRRLPKRWGW